MRVSEVERITNETEIRVRLNLDGVGENQIESGIGFLDHMLQQVAIHGFFDLTLKAKGDLHIDPHHTVEDCGLVLGAAFSKALGERRGIVRISESTVPMDEALAQLVVDLSGRPYSKLVTEWSSPTVGNLPTTLIEHFFESFSVTCACNLHARILSGRDNHHMVEALFKAFGRALDSATNIDPRRQNLVPSSKGRIV
jgi:imidazoleglycerol-phosphate dehydratase